MNSTYRKILMQVVSITTVVVHSLSPVRLFATHGLYCSRLPPSFTISWHLFKFMSIELVMLFNHHIFWYPILLPSIFPSIRVFSNESALHIKWPKCWSFSFIINLSNEYSVIQHWFPLGLTGGISSQSKGLSRVFSNTTVLKHQFFSAQLSLDSNSHIHTWLPEKP